MIKTKNTQLPLDILSLDCIPSSLFTPSDTAINFEILKINSAKDIIVFRCTKKISSKDIKLISVTPTGTYELSLQIDKILINKTDYVASITSIKTKENLKTIITNRKEKAYVQNSNITSDTQPNGISMPYSIIAFSSQSLWIEFKSISDVDSILQQLKDAKFLDIRSQLNEETDRIQVGRKHDTYAKYLRFDIELGAYQKLKSICSNISERDLAIDIIKNSNKGILDES